MGGGRRGGDDIGGLSNLILGSGNRLGINVKEWKSGERKIFRSMKMMNMRSLGEVAHCFLTEV